MTYEEQLKALLTPPAREEIVPKTQYTPAHIPGSIVEHKLNEIFGPDHWGVVVHEWPTLISDIGTAPFFVGKYTVWFEFANGRRVERPAIGWIAAQPRKGGGVADIQYSNVQMAMEGCITEAVKFGASTLGPALGLGMHNETAQRLMADNSDSSSPPPEPRGGKLKPTRPSDESPDWDAVKLYIVKQKLPIAFRDAFVALAQARDWGRKETKERLDSWMERYRREPEQCLADLTDSVRLPEEPIDLPPMDEIPEVPH